MTHEKSVAVARGGAGKAKAVALLALATALVGLTGCASDSSGPPDGTSTSSPSPPLTTEESTTDAPEEIEELLDLTDPIPTSVLCEALAGSDLGAVSAANAEKRDESDRGGNSRCTFTASDGTPSEVVLQLVSNTSAASGSAFELPDLTSQNCTTGQNTALIELAGLETATWYCLDSDTSMNVYPVSSYVANATLRGTSLRCEISTVNRPGFDPAAAEAWCAGVLSGLDSSL